jgi:hypothetical protein
MLLHFTVGVVCRSGSESVKRAMLFCHWPFGVSLILRGANALAGGSRLEDDRT